MAAINESSRDMCKQNIHLKSVALGLVFSLSNKGGDYEPVHTLHQQEECESSESQDPDREGRNISQDELDLREATVR